MGEVANCECGKGARHSQHDKQIRCVNSQCWTGPAMETWGGAERHWNKVMTPPATGTAVWSRDDPRESMDRGGIVVVSPDKVFLGAVETKHSYCVFFGTDRRLLQADEEWPPEWFWVRGPT